MVQTAASLIPPNTDLTDKDFDSLHARLRNLIRSVFPRWTEESVANFGNILVQMNAHVGDVLMYYLDKWARESRIVTAQLRRSLLNLVKIIDFQPEGATAAQATETFTLSAVTAGDVTFPAGTIVKTADITEPVKFQLLEDLVISAGSTSESAVVENSESASSQFVSASLPNQVYTLNATPFLEGSAVVVAGDGTYSRVDNFLDSSATDKHFVLAVDAQDKATIRFGNGINGSIPSGTIDVDYKTGGGSIGQLEENTLTVIEGIFKDQFDNPVVVTVNNAAQTDGGLDRQTNAQIKLLAPRSLRVLERAVAREDYEIVADQVSGVARSLMLFKNQEPAIAENAGILFIVPVGGGTPSQTLLDLISSQFDQVDGFDPPATPKPNTLNLSVQTANYLSVDVSMIVYRRSGVLTATLKAAVTTALTNFFAVEIAASQLLADDPVLAAAQGITSADGDSLVPNPRIGFGFEYKDADGNPTGLFAHSDVHNAVRDVAEVGRIEPGTAGFLLNGERDDVILNTFQFPTLGTVIIRDGDTGLIL
jgi:hypothetical protein